jgi:hypothetical protein
MREVFSYRYRTRFVVVYRLPRPAVQLNQNAVKGIRLVEVRVNTHVHASGMRKVRQGAVAVPVDVVAAVVAPVPGPHGVMAANDIDRLGALGAGNLELQDVPSLLESLWLALVQALGCVVVVAPGDVDVLRVQQVEPLRQPVGVAEGQIAQDDEMVSGREQRVDVVLDGMIVGLDVVKMPLRMLQDIRVKQVPVGREKVSHARNIPGGQNLSSGRV